MLLVCILVISFCLVNPADVFTLICSPLTVQAQPGQDVVLSCRAEPPFDLSHWSLEWKRDSDIVHVHRSQGDDPNSQDPKFKGRASLNHEKLKDGKIPYSLSNFTKEDEGNYSICLRKQDLFRCSTITLIEVPQRTNETHKHPGSGRGPGVIAGIVFGVIVIVVLGIGFFLSCRRNITDLTDSASIALRDMGRTEPSQPPSDEGGVEPGQVTNLMMKPSSETKSWWRCCRFMTVKEGQKQLEKENVSCDGVVVL